uniref:hypothetical protein n=1 Tax=Pararhizobium sp. IMCC3301 TaxID=3067904 RepID=UPI00274133D0|nr:hypothetical protein [Pararhizobium sp. IMCC3301]
MTEEILIAGGGWRVQRFILPALELVGLTAAHTTILRRNGEEIPDFKDVSVISDLDKYDKQPNRVINCLPADVMLAKGTDLLSLFPNAIHFWDTPTSASFTNLLKSLRNPDYDKIISLEDFVKLPNLDCMTKATGDNTFKQLHHFGIPVHFLSVVRMSLRNAGRNTALVRRKGAKIVAGHGIGMKPKKNPKKAEIIIKGSNGRCLDIFDLKTHNDTQVRDQLTRIVSDGQLIYQLNDENLSSYDLSPRLVAEFSKPVTRTQVHELDKILALTRILGESGNQYRFKDSIADCLGQKMIKKVGFFILRN